MLRSVFAGRAGLTALIAIVALAGLASPALAGDWEKIGERHVNFRADRDTINLDADMGPYTSVRLRVLENGIRVGDVTVHFANGGSFDAQIRNLIPADGYTRSIDLPGTARHITRLVLTYQTVGRIRNGRAKVQVFGRNTERVAPVAPVQEIPAAQVAEGWRLLGERRVDFGGDTDVLNVNENRGPFLTLRLGALDNGVIVTGMRITFGNGDVQGLAGPYNIPRGQLSDPIDLEGPARQIEQISIRYRSRANLAAGRATVRVFGKVLRQADEGWERLGARLVNFRSETDRIMVTASEGRFARIKLLVEENSIALTDLIVHFGNGESQDVRVRRTLNDGESTRQILLDGEGSRVIQSIELSYSTEGRPADGRALVYVFGQSGAAAPPDPDDEWTLLGIRSVRLLGDTDTIQVERNDGLIGRLRLRVLDNAVFIATMTVHFRNGGSETFEVNRPIAAGDHSPAIDLRGGQRRIQRVVLEYTTAGRAHNGRATVQLWGR